MYARKTTFVTNKSKEGKTKSCKGQLKRLASRKITKKHKNTPYTLNNAHKAPHRINTKSHSCEDRVTYIYNIE